MNIEYDPVKDQVNQFKHGISLSMAAHLEWDWLWATEDLRRDYGETRMIGYEPIGTRVYCVVYTDRDGVRRIISLRKANKREVKRYASIV